MSHLELLTFGALGLAVLWWSAHTWKTVANRRQLCFSFVAFAGIAWGIDHRNKQIEDEHRRAELELVEKTQRQQAAWAAFNAESRRNQPEEVRQDVERAFRGTGYHAP